MNKKKKALLVGGIVLVLLVGVMLALLFTQPQDDTNISPIPPAAEENVYLYQEEENSLKSLQVTNETGTYSLEQLGEQRWSIKDLEDYKTDTDAYTDTVKCYTQLAAKQKLLDKVTDKAKYGLDSPTGTGVITFKKGITHTVIVGDMTPDETGYYSMVDDDEALYIISVADAQKLQQSQLAYLNMTIIEGYDAKETETVSTIEKMTIERKDLDYKVVMEKAQQVEDEETRLHASTLQMVSPVVCDCDAQHTDEEIILPLFGLTAEEVVALNAETVKSQYGFDDPTAAIVLQYDGNTATMTFGSKADDESYYMMFNENNVIYRVKTEKVAALTVDPNSLISRLGILPYIGSVKTMTIGFKDKTYIYELSGEDDELKIILDGKEIDTNNFRQLYQLILNPGLEAIYTGTVTDEPAISITYEYRAGGSDIIELYDVGGRQMVYALNGQANRSGRSAYLDKLEQELQNLIDGKEVNTDW